MSEWELLSCVLNLHSHSHGSQPPGSSVRMHFLSKKTGVGCHIFFFRCADEEQLNNLRKQGRKNIGGHKINDKCLSLLRVLWQNITGCVAYWKYVLSGGDSGFWWELFSWIGEIEIEKGRAGKERGREREKERVCLCF